MTKENTTGVGYESQPSKTKNRQKTTEKEKRDGEIKKSEKERKKDKKKRVERERKKTMRKKSEVRDYMLDYIQLPSLATQTRT